MRTKALRITGGLALLVLLAVNLALPGLAPLPARAQGGLPAGGYTSGSWHCFSLNATTYANGTYTLLAGSFDGTAIVTHVGGEARVRFRIPGYTFKIGSADGATATGFTHAQGSSGTVTHGERFYDILGNEVGAANVFGGGTGPYGWFPSYTVIPQYNQIEHIDFYYTGGAPQVQDYRICLDPASLQIATTPTPTLTPTPTFAPTATPLLTPVGTCTSSWTLKYDFATVGNHNHQGWLALPTMTTGGFIDNDGYHPSVKPLLTDGSKYAFYLVISRQLSAGTVITALSIDVDYIPGQPFAQDLRQIKVKNGSTTLIDAGSPPPAGRQTYSWTGYAPGDVLELALYATGAQNSQAIIFEGDAVLKSITLSGTGRTPEGTCVPAPGGQSGNTDPNNAWAYPVAQAEQTGLKQLAVGQTVAGPEIFRYLTEGVPSSPAYDTTKTATLFFAKDVHVSVHNAADGTVTAVEPIAREAVCTAITTGFKLPTYTCAHNYALTAYAFAYQSVYRVTVALSGSVTLSYLVTSPTVMVGQTVTKSCILGQAIPFYVFQLNPTVIQSEYHLDPAGYTIVQGRDSNTPFDLTPRFAEEPRDIQCGLPATSGCTLVKNPTLTDSASQWSALDLAHPPRNPPGQTQGLLLTSGVRQSINLDTTKQYIINIKARLLSPTGDIRTDFSVKLGSSPEQTVLVTGINSEVTTIPAATYTPNSDTWFDLVISPTANTRGNVLVDFICINDPDELPVAPSECLLRNFEFDSDQHWTLDSGIVQYNGGMAWLQQGSVITQPVTLSPKASGPQQYKISMVARRYGGPAPGESVALDWSLSGGSSGIGDTLAGLTTQNFKSKEDLFTVDTQTTYTLNLEAVGSGGTGQTLQIDRICIQTADGVSPPGYKNLPPVPITVQCKVCAYSPVGDVNVDLPEVIGWLECSLSQIWHCQCKTILLGIWQTLVDLLTFLGFWRLWLSYTTIAWAEWGNANLVAAMRYVNALVLNAQTAIVDAISYGPRGVIITDSGTNFWDALVSLFNGVRDVVTQLTGLVSQVVDRVFWLVLLLVAVIIAVINLIIQFVLAAGATLVNFVTVLLTTITSSLSAPPVTAIGIPICDMQAQMIPESCVGLFIIEQSLFFEGSPLVVILPLAEGLLAFTLFWWAIHQFKGALEAG